MHHNTGKGQIGRKVETGGGQRLLIAVTVLGSTGPLRFVVSEDLAVSAVIQTALRLYAREGRLPVLGYDMNGFLLYCANSGADGKSLALLSSLLIFESVVIGFRCRFEALSPWEAIGSEGTRNFLLCRKQVVMGEAPETQPVVGQKLGRRKNWKTWLKSSFSFSISSH